MRKLKTQAAKDWFAFFVVASLGVILEAIDIKTDFVNKTIWEPMSNALNSPVIPSTLSNYEVEVVLLVGILVGVVFILSKTNNRN